MSYIVKWENEFPGKDEDENLPISSPLEAAREAFDDISRGYTLGFTVTNTKTGEEFSVDLSENDEDAAIEIK